MQSGVLGTLSLLVALVPIALVVAALSLSSWRQRTRLAEIERQIAVTDAIHAVLGAVVSPVVRRSLRGGWRLAIPVPLDRPDTVVHIVEAACGVFSPSERAKPGRFEIVLSAQERPVPRRARVLVPARGESVSWT
ncbi:MAG: hypothetical protein ACREK4_18080 [Candidatus Rokuibacteriota bacterium]